MAAEAHKEVRYAIKLAVFVHEDLGITYRLALLRRNLPIEHNQVGDFPCTVRFVSSHHIYLTVSLIGVLKHGMSRFSTGSHWIQAGYNDIRPRQSGGTDWGVSIYGIEVCRLDIFDHVSWL